MITMEPMDNMHRRRQMLKEACLTYADHPEDYITVVIAQHLKAHGQEKSLSSQGIGRVKDQPISAADGIQEHQAKRSFRSVLYRKLFLPRHTRLSY